MMMTKLRVARLNWKLSEFLMNDKGTQDLYRKGNSYKGGEKITEDKFFHSFINEICDDVVNSIVHGEPTYLLSKRYLDISNLVVFITSQKFLIINLDEVWELSKEIVKNY
jgi:hypothetical protein